MRQALHGVVPPAIVNRKKLGFPTPTRVWLRGEMYEWARDILTTSGAGDLLDLSYAMRLLRRAQAGGGRPLPQGVDGAGLLHLARHLRGAAPSTRASQRNQSALLTKPVVGSMVR